MKYIRRKRCGKICLASPFFLWHVLHPSSLPKMPVKSKDWHWDLHWQCNFSEIVKPLLVLIGLDCRMIYKHADAYIYILYVYIYDIIQHIPRMAFWCAKCSSPNPWFFLRRFFQRTAMDAPVLTLPLPREAVLQGYQVQDRPVTMRDQTAADCRSHALGFNCNIPRIDSKQNILTGFFVEFWNLIKVHSLESGCQRPWPQQLEMHRTWKVW